MSRDKRERLVDAEQVEPKRPDADGTSQFHKVADTLRVLAHPHRLQMLGRLRLAARTVGWLAADCGIRRHAASEHLRLMQKLGFVTSQRQGRYTYYRLEGSLGRQLIDTIESWPEALPERPEALPERNAQVTEPG